MTMKKALVALLVAVIILAGITYVIYPEEPPVGQEEEVSMGTATLERTTSR